MLRRDAGVVLPVEHELTERLGTPGPHLGRRRRQDLAPRKRGIAHPVPNHPPEEAPRTRGAPTWAIPLGIRRAYLGGRHPRRHPSRQVVEKREAAQETAAIPAGPVRDVVDALVRRLEGHDVEITVPLTLGGDADPVLQAVAQRLEHLSDRFLGDTRASTAEPLIPRPIHAHGDGGGCRFDDLSGRRGRAHVVPVHADGEL